MKTFYDIPTQVMFKEKDSNYWEAGIAYRDEFICACCGGITELGELAEAEDVGEIEVVEFPDWVNFTYEITEA